ncbi:MAG: hypothetical protein JNM93_07930 [Bacteriovoracaceae bacterium]|nr:hypothetical protein [Bacteriovoracaceae bacterium]
MIIVSVITFFHFQLAHDISVIENWIYNNNWEILILSKVTAFYSTLYLLSLKYIPIKEYVVFLKKGFQNPNHFIFVAMIFLFTFMTVLGKAQYQENHSRFTGHQLVAFIGNSLFYLLDFSLLYFLRNIFPFYKKWENQFFISFFTAMFFIISILTVPYQKSLIGFLLLHFLTMLLFTSSQSNKWIVGVCYVIFFIGPSSFLIGIDPVWGSDFAVFKLTKVVSPIYVLALWFIALFYFYYMRGRRIIY